MPYQIHTQYIDLDSGMHVAEIRNERGHKHIAQVALAKDGCVACGHLHAKDGLNDLEPKVMFAAVIAELDKGERDRLAYARKHNLKVK